MVTPDSWFHWPMTITAFRDGRGKQYGRYRLESLHRDTHSGRGESNSPLLMAGGLINLQCHPNGAFNTLWQLSRVHYHAE